jgi:hypothetical protein
MNQLLASQVLDALSEQGIIAGQIRDFVAPLAAVIIGVIGLKYLFGDQRSLAGFIGFLFLGIIVFGLIKWGDSILESLGGVFSSWVAPDSRSGDVIIAGLIFLGIGVVFAFAAIWAISIRREVAEQDQDEPVGSDGGEVVVLPSRAEYTEAALGALGELAPRDRSAVDRLRNQVRLAVIVAVERGVFDPGSTVTPEHLAKWVVLRDMWPEVVEALWTRPNLLKVLEEAPFEEFTRDEALFQFLRIGQRLHPVSQHLLYMSPVIEAAG